MEKKRLVYCIAMLLAAGPLFAQAPASNISNDSEAYRPQIHFSPKAHWINDPNGMVFYKGVYHLFFQHYPESSVWGPMHWGHATSADLVHWQQQPIALYPDSLGYIFSGSAVVDKNNTSGFGKNGEPPLVAIFTHHDPVGEKAGTNNFQNQSIAYSTDEGKTWIKYAGNPVVKNPGIRDFRDPKVMWYEPQKKWIMTLATSDRVTFFSSPDLKNWKRESDFGKEAGAHGGGWECPDLFTLDDNGKEIWVLIANLNPGGPNKGSGTQYFLGDFDGNQFTPFSTATKWLDYGPDDYAGITWSNTGNRKIFIGWMSNWLYANKVPTEKWRNALTIPRELKIKHVGNDMLVTSMPVAELNSLQQKQVTKENFTVTKSLDITAGAASLPIHLKLSPGELKDFSIVLSNVMGEELLIGYDKDSNNYYIDRTKSGKTDFQQDFAARHIAPRLANTGVMNVTLIIDASSVELFGDDGLTVMTEIFFPDTPYNRVRLQTPGTLMVKRMEYAGLKSTLK